MKKKNVSGVIYSTNPDFEYQSIYNEDETLENTKQELKIWLDRRGGGKVVSRVVGFIGKIEDFQVLKKNLQNLCGTGGTIKDYEILIQGDHRDKILAYLLKEKYKAKKSGG